MSAIILEKEQFEITITRLCYELIENHDPFQSTALIGLQPRGIYLAQSIHHRLKSILGDHDFAIGNLDTTFYRDDFRRRDEPIIPSSSDINFLMEGKNVIMIDDVLYTGRTVRAGLDAMLDYGRPSKVEFLVLVDRRYSRQLPVEPDYVGMQVDTRASQQVKVEWEATEGANKVWLLNQ